jgi:SAM-dependent methyltransferase
MSLVLEEHRHYLADRRRVDAFASAIAATVRHGDTVVDLGCGTGILGMLALRAGASHVYAIDSTSTLELARAIAAANGLSDRITFIRGRSTEVTLPARADVVVADQLGPFGYGAGLLDYFADARARLLEPDGRTIPGSLVLAIAPVESRDSYERIAFWTESVAGVSLKAAARSAANTAHAVHLAQADLLAAPTHSAPISCDVVPERLSLAADVMATRNGTLHGLGGWFVAQLAPGVTLTNDPSSASCMDREQVFYPLETPVDVKQDDRITVDMTVRPGDRVVAWRVAVHDAAGETRFEGAQCSFAGMLIGPEDLRRARV